MTNAEFEKKMEERALVFSMCQEANRAEAMADFVHKIDVMEKGIGETVYWVKKADELLPFSTVNRKAEPMW